MTYDPAQDPASEPDPSDGDTSEVEPGKTDAPGQNEPDDGTDEGGQG